MTRKSWMCVLVVAFTILWPLSAVWGQGMDKIVEGAKKEGQLKLGITLRWEVAGKPSGKKLIEAFQARYPLVKVDFKSLLHSGNAREPGKSNAGSPSHSRLDFFDLLDQSRNDQGI